jgi:hypothetical protein
MASKLATQFFARQGTGKLCSRHFRSWSHWAQRCRKIVPFPAPRDHLPQSEGKIRIKLFCLIICLISFKVILLCNSIADRFRFVSFEDLLRESDILVITASANAESQGRFGHEQFRLMKKDAILVNVSRLVLIVYWYLYSNLNFPYAEAA